MQDLIQQGLTESDINTAQNLINKFQTTTQNNQIETSSSYLTWGSILAIIALISGISLGHLAKDYMDNQQSQANIQSTNGTPSTVQQPTQNTLSLRDKLMR